MVRAVDYNDTKFLKMCRKFGLKRIIGSPDFWVAVIVSTLFSLICGSLLISKEMISNLSIILITISAAMLAVIIAGLAIVVSIADDNFVKLLKKVGIYENILFVFWYSAIISASSVVFTTMSYILTKTLNNEIILWKYTLNNLIFTIMLLITVFLSLHALFSVISLIGTTMRYGLYRGAFIENGYQDITK